MALEDNYWVCILFRLAKRTFVRSFKPCEYTLGMKNMFTRKFLLRTPGYFLKTHGTRLGKVGVALSLVTRQIPALRPVRSH